MSTDYRPETEYLRHRAWLDSQIAGARDTGFNFDPDPHGLFVPIAPADTADGGQGNETLPTFMFFASYDTSRTADDLARTVAGLLSTFDFGLTVLPMYGIWRGTVEPGVQVIVQANDDNDGRRDIDQIGNVLSKLGCRYLHVIRKAFVTRHVDTDAESVSSAFDRLPS